jgi:DNA polymerase elongation subunit (family B)
VALACHLEEGDPFVDLHRRENQGALTVPNTAHTWTDDEEEAAVEYEWPEFAARFNDGEGKPLITYHAYRQRRALLTRDVGSGVAPELVSVPAMPVGKGPEDFVGLTIGFWDIETTYSSQPRVLYAAVADAWGSVTEFALDDPQYAGREWIDDSRLVSAMARHIERYDVITHWNGARFDIPVTNGRLGYHRVRWQRDPLPYPWLRDYRDLMPLDLQISHDLMYKAGGQFNRIGRRSLQSVSEYYESANRKTPLSPMIWDRADHGSEEDYALIKEHCVADVLVLRDVFSFLKPHVRVLHRSS